MSLLSDIKSDLKQAMLDKNILVRDTIRMFLAEVQKFEIDSKEVADDAKVLQIINKMIKQRNDSIEQFTKGGRDDLVAKELSEVDVLNKYKPAQLSEDQIILRVREAISISNASSMQDIGKVMGLLKNSLSGSADMGIVSKVVKDQLS
ncbi:GatB/YqeY domain-containing protein [Gammaproteobacteria bacterium]|nr:GatB/YqeY domain-containing protein [Gammaproteobacteria bacterium]MDA8856605.1 GatB/YqeY domain-containing protein [Gammaproteobacteria bacterium]MDA8957543.1 GatB/YqeY domain-containing protein [Gammaproteobacteria bacterium]MDA9010795.1 GatB/YqeY domain-containing protein [Gammaproteobacteria bacterium]MDA9024349.1 GatB/YqeY domain-containing protein [Gammaproteobacteria bacterium]